MQRGQSMWILTKMAMIFFIGSLALLLLIFGGFTRIGLCKASAEASSNRVATAINQIINSPLEDERRVVFVEPALAIGESKSARYNMTITNRVLNDPAKPFNTLLILAQSQQEADCRGGIAVNYQKSFHDNNRLFLLSPRSVSSPSSEFRQTITLKPSVLSTEPDYLLRTKFVIVMKCTSKTIAQEKYLFIQDCVEESEAGCIKFDSALVLSGSGNEIKSICSFTA